MRDPLFHTKGALRTGHQTHVARRSDAEADLAIKREEYLYTVAPRQMGKTTLLKRLAGQMEIDGWQCCFVDLATLKGYPKTIWFERLTQKIARRLDCPVPHSARNQSDFESFLFEQVGLSRIDKPVRLALLFDEIEGLLKLQFSDEFLMVLRDLYQHREDYPGRLVVAFAGAVDINTLVTDQSISPFNVAEEIHIEDFSEEESYELTSKLSALNVPIDPRVHTAIYSWASGHPYLTQRICAEVENSIYAGLVTRIDPDEIDKIVQIRIVDPKKRDHNIKHAQGRINSLQGTALHLWHRLLAGETISATDPGFYALYLTGAVDEDSHGRVSIRNRIYEQILSIQKPPKSGNLYNHPLGQEGQRMAEISILFLAADPTDASRLRLSEEFREIDEQLTLAKQRDSFNLAIPQLSLRPKDISRTLLRSQPQVVHFSGHGTSEGALCFENEVGQVHLVQPDALAALFGEFAGHVNCVLLNACYSEAQAKAIAEHINFVIGMRKAISDKAAIAFALGFYQALGAGRTIEEAYRLGCVQIRLMDIPEHLTPVLIRKDG